MLTYRGICAKKALNVIQQGCLKHPYDGKKVYKSTYNKTNRLCTFHVPTYAYQMGFMVSESVFGVTFLILVMHYNYKGFFPRFAGLLNNNISCTGVYCIMHLEPNTIRDVFTGYSVCCVLTRHSVCCVLTRFNVLYLHDV